MNVLSFLKTYQPMPNDEFISEELIIQFDEVRKYAMLNPKEEYIEPFLRSYGSGDGLGIYPLIEDFFLLFNKKTVCHYLKAVLEDTQLGVDTRYWVCQVAMLFPCETLNKGMLLSSEIGNDDTKEVVEMYFNM